MSETTSIRNCEKNQTYDPFILWFFEAICLNCCLPIQMQYIDLPLLCDGYKITKKKHGNFQHQQCLDEFIYRFGQRIVRFAEEEKVKNDETSKIENWLKTSTDNQTMRPLFYFVHNFNNFD